MNSKKAKTVRESKKGHFGELLAILKYEDIDLNSDQWYKYIFEKGIIVVTGKLNFNQVVVVNNPVNKLKNIDNYTVIFINSSKIVSIEI